MSYNYNYKTPILDLHGTDCNSADYLIEKFITDNLDNLPIKIITGHSNFFINKTKGAVKKYKLFCYKENYTNAGCWVIISSPWIS
tara:strand:- start:2034 stop:2288 length:255 start_codon:yes stop_codon:yes gene_type:complete